MEIVTSAGTGMTTLSNSAVFFWCFTWMLGSEWNITTVYPLSLIHISVYIYSRPNFINWSSFLYPHTFAMLSKSPNANRKKAAPLTTGETKKPASISINIKMPGLPLVILSERSFFAKTSMAPVCLKYTQSAPAKIS